MKTEKFGGKNHRLVLFLLPLLFAAPLFAQDNSQGAQPDAQQSAQPDAQQEVQNDQNNPPGRVARLSQLQGNVSLQPSGETDWTAAGQNDTMTSGDRIYTDTDSRAELEIGPFAVRLSQLTDLTVVNLNDQLAQFGIAQGTAQITIFKLPEGDTVELDTPNGALTLQSPGTYRADTDPTNGYTLVSVYRGSLQVSGGDVSQTVGEGQAVRLTGSDQIQVANASLAPVDDFEKWVQTRDQRVSSAHTAEHVSPYMPGANDLDEYGQWQTGTDGPVWYPSGVAVGWVPYRVGHWAWVEPWGWTWVEAEPWGFAPFHYGRWAFYGGRWGWLPGPVVVAPIYSPALVAFVGGPGFSVGFGVGGFGLSAWFPLGPGEPFIPWYHYGPRYLREVNITNIRNITNINITNVQNIHYAYRTTAITAVNAETFRSGQPVQRGIVKVTPEQMARAQVIAHPAVNPARSAIVSHPVAAPKGVPPTTNFAAISRAAHTAPGATTRTNTPPSRIRPNPPAGDSRNTPPVSRNMTPPATANNGRYGPPTASRPPFVTKNPPPAPKPAFSTRQPAMYSHPGRPLEPQQLDNLRNGRPAGPQQDRELAPHAVPLPHAAPPQHAAPPAQKRP
jgi:hypothetical protein